MATPAENRRRINDVAQRVECPVCERRPGYPCQRLSGWTITRSHVFDNERGGLVGINDAVWPHDERYQLGKAAP